MKRTLLVSTVFLVGLSAAAEEQFQPLPVPVTNNAVAAVRINGQLLVNSLMGLGAQKNWSSVTNAAYALNEKYNKWTAIRPAPGSGRVGKVAGGDVHHVFLLVCRCVHPVAADAHV